MKKSLKQEVNLWQNKSANYSVSRKQNKRLKQGESWSKAKALSRTTTGHKTETFEGNSLNKLKT